MKYKFVFFLLFLTIIFLIGYAFNTSSNHLKTLSTCISDSEVKFHYHAFVKIIFLNKPYRIPDNLGISKDCQHPIQVHDGARGEIHVHSYKNFPYTIGDFFTVWGIPFDKERLGSILFGDTYTVSMKVNGKENEQFQNYVFDDKDLIQIEISLKK